MQRVEKKELMPKSIIKDLPTGYKWYYSHIYSAYKELKEGDKLKLFTYTVSDIKMPSLRNIANYKRQFERQEAILKKIYPNIENINQILCTPRHPREIQLELERNLFYFTSSDNVRTVLKAVFGTKKLSKKNQLEMDNIKLFKKLVGTKFKINSKERKELEKKLPHMKPPKLVIR